MKFFRSYSRRHMSATEQKYDLMAKSIPAGYKMGKPVSGKSLHAGQKLLAYYNSTNEGCDVIEILGVTGSEQKYGEGGVKFLSVAECLKYYNFKSLTEMDNHQDIPEYGHHSYIVARDLTWEKDSSYDESGPWYYLYEGRWARGSGAEKLSFVELIEDRPEQKDFERTVLTIEPEVPSYSNRFLLGLED